MFPERLMLCVESPETLEKAAPEVKWLAAALSCPITVFHALRPYASELETYREWKRERAKEVEAAAERCGLNEFEVHVDDGPTGVTDAITDAALRVGADLVVIPTHARRGLARLVFGSVAESVTRSCRIPVLTVDLERLPLTTRRAAFDHVYALTDFSEPARRAIERAHVFSRRIEREMEVVHIVESVQPASELVGFSSVAADIQSLLESGAKEHMAAELSRFEQAMGERPPHRIEVGPFDVTLRELAAEHENPVFIMATAGRDSFGDHVLGSRTERAIRTEGVTVLAFPARFLEFGTIGTPASLPA